MSSIQRVLLIVVIGLLIGILFGLLTHEQRHCRFALSGHCRIYELR